MAGGAERWALLLATLLHDVPWKPWIVTGRLSKWGGLEERVKSSEACRRYAYIVNASERNDREAQALVAWIACKLAEKGAESAAERLVKVAKGEWGRTIHDADVLASSIDRLVSPPFRPSEIDAVKIVNVFNPSLVLEDNLLRYAGSIPAVVDTFLKKLEDVIDGVVGSCREMGASEECILRRLYTALYTLLEVTWYDACIEGGKSGDGQGKRARLLPPPADTRVPHHTVFDHLRASATSLALRGKSVYALVDIPGVHVFVSKARKTRDFWAGSWLLSALAWGAVRRIVEEEGPQVTILPAVHLNPFYLDVLVSEVPGVEEKLPPLAWRELGKWPSQPVMPATLSLLLDGERWNCEKLRESVESGFREAWRLIWEPLREQLKKLADEVNGESLPDWCNPFNWSDTVAGAREERVAVVVARLLCLHALASTGGEKREAAQLLRKLFEYLLAAMEEVPLDVRVSCIEVDFERDKGFEGFVDEVARLLGNVQIAEGERGEVKSVVMLLEEIVQEASGRGVDARTLLNRMLRFTYLRLRLEEEARGRPNVAPTGIHRVYDRIVDLWEEARRVSHRAYRYCSMCGKLPAVARLPRIGDTVVTPRGELRIVGSSGEKSGRNYWTLDELLEKVDYLIDEGEALCPYCLLRRLLARYPWLPYKLVESATRAKRVRINSTFDTANEWLRDEICEKLRDERVCTDASLEHIIRALEMTGEKTLPPLYRRVAVVYGDGDLLGSGYLRGILLVGEEKWPENGDTEPILRRLLGEKSALAGLLGGMLRRIEAGEPGFRLDAVPALIYNYLLQFNALGKVDERSVLVTAALASSVTSVLRKRGVLKKGDWPLTLVPTLSYMRAFSTSLMVASLVDALIIDALRGVLIYAGGDDVLAVVPPAAPYKRLNSIYEELGNRLSRVSVEEVKPESLRIYNASIQKGSVSIALAAVVYTRLNYWGLLGGNPGFHVYRGIVAPAAIAHGRSYGVNLAHYRDPLWSILGQAEHLMNMKDGVKVVLIGGKRGVRKDVAVIGFEGSGVGVVPQALLTHEERARLAELTRQGIERVLRGLALTARVYEWIEGGKYSRSLVYDALEEINSRLMRELSLHSPEYLERLALSLLARNAQRTASREDNDNMVVKDLARVRIRFEGRGGVEEPLFTHVFRAVRNLLAASRR